MKENKKFAGIFPAVITPFDEEQEVDRSRLKDFLDHLIEGGVHGLYLLGTNGEAPLLTFEEKKGIIETALDHVDDRVPVIVGSMCNSTIKTIKLSKFAQQKGADAVHVIIPYYYPMSGSNLKDHIKRLAVDIKIPIFLYSIPQFTGNELRASTVIDLLDIDRFIGLKDSSGDVEFFYRTLKRAREKRKDFVYFGGNDSLILHYLMHGSDGSVTAVGNAFPELVSGIYEDHGSGDIYSAVQKQERVLEIKDVFSDYPALSAVKGALKARGKDYGDLREPMYSLSEGELKEIENKLESIGVI